MLLLHMSGIGGAGNAGKLPIAPGTGSASDRSSSSSSSSSSMQVGDVAKKRALFEQAAKNAGTVSTSTSKADYNVLDKGTVQKRATAWLTAFSNMLEQLERGGRVTHAAVNALKQQLEAHLNSPSTTASSSREDSQVAGEVYAIRERLEALTKRANEEKAPKSRELSSGEAASSVPVGSPSSPERANKNVLENIQAALVQVSESVPSGEEARELQRALAASTVLEELGNYTPHSQEAKVLKELHLAVHHLVQANMGAGNREAMIAQCQSASIAALKAFEGHLGQGELLAVTQQALAKLEKNEEGRVQLHRSIYGQLVTFTKAFHTGLEDKLDGVEEQLRDLPEGVAGVDSDWNSRIVTRQKELEALKNNPTQLPLAVPGNKGYIMAGVSVLVALASFLAALAIGNEGAFYPLAAVGVALAGILGLLQNKSHATHAAEVAKIKHHQELQREQIQRLESTINQLKEERIHAEQNVAENLAQLEAQRSRLQREIGELGTVTEEIKVLVPLLEDLVHFFTEEGKYATGVE